MAWQRDKGGDAYRCQQVPEYVFHFASANQCASIGGEFAIHFFRPPFTAPKPSSKIPTMVVDKRYRPLVIAVGGLVQFCQSSGNANWLAGQVSSRHRGCGIGIPSPYTFPAKFERRKLSAMRYLFAMPKIKDAT
jgi:hypothetical protein